MLPAVTVMHMSFRLKFFEFFFVALSFVDLLALRKDLMSKLKIDWLALQPQTFQRFRIQRTH